jgi:hypothetical protein
MVMALRSGVGVFAFWWVRLVAALAGIAALVMIPAAAEQEPAVLRGAMPTWVDIAPTPPTNPKRLRQVDDGVYELLQDTQIKIDGFDQTYLRRTLRKVIDRSGLEGAAQIETEFDPTTDRLTLNRAMIWRAGKAIDVTASAAIEVLRREGELEDGIITGQRTAVLRLNDVRVGDTTDIVWSWRETKSSWPGHHFSEHALGWSVPVARTRVRVTAPADLQIATRETNGGPKVAVTRAGAEQTLSWDVVDPEPMAGEDDTPAGYEPWPEAQISTMPDWGQVVRWARPFYAVDPTLPADLGVKIDEIAAKTNDPKVRITAALRLVQDSVRYTSLSIGSGGFTPRPPARTWAEGFGDCKDKTTLLIAVLNRLAIKAVPALTDIDEGAALSTVLPSANAFDHVIVRVDGLAEPLWLDPTGSHQGGQAATLATLGYGFALPLRDGQTRLEALPHPVPAKPTVQVFETHKRSADGIAMAMRAVYSGDEADIKRSDLSTKSLASMEADDLKFFADMYPGIEQKGDFKITDDREGNVVTIRQAYWLPKDVKDYGDTVASYQINAWPMRDLYKTPAAGKRRTAHTLPHPIYRTHQIILVTPGASPASPEDETVDGPAFSFARSSKRDGDRLTIDFSLKGKGARVEVGKVAEYRDNAQALDDNTYAYVDLDSDDGGGAGPVVTLFALILGVGVGAALLVIAVRDANAKEAAGLDEGWFRPVGALKFVILSMISFNFYAVYWMWRCWRRYRVTEQVVIRPFARAFFMPFWIYQLYRDANDRAEPKAPLWVGGVCTGGYVLFALMAHVGERQGVDTWQVEGVSMIAVMALLPVVRLINRINDPDLVARASRFGAKDWIALGCGLPLWLVITFAV